MLARKSSERFLNFGAYLALEQSKALYWSAQRTSKLSIPASTTSHQPTYPHQRESHGIGIEVCKLKIQSE